MSMQIMKEEEGEKSVRCRGNQWVRGRLLGRGGFGQVHLAHFLHGQAVTAVKSCALTCSKELSTEKKLLEGFTDCPFIVRYLGYDVTHNPDDKEQKDLVLNVFLEFANAGALFDLVSVSPYGLPELVVRCFTKCILSAIHRVHQEGFVHCDVKLENILLFKQPNSLVAKLADFGLSRPETESVPGVFGGTRLYWAPEIQSWGVQGKAADIWALGQVVSRMRKGSLPQNGSRHISYSAMDFMANCLEEDPQKRATAAMLMRHPFVNEQEQVPQLPSGSAPRCIIPKQQLKAVHRYRPRLPPRFQKLQPQACCL